MSNCQTSAEKLGNFTAEVFHVLQCPYFYFYAGNGQRVKLLLPDVGVVAARAEGGRSEGTQGDTTERQEGDLAQTKATARLSSEVNEFDKPFVLASNGTTTFGEVSKDSGLTEAPIKLSLGENRFDEEGGKSWIWS